jgi:hypothetical protein
VTRGPRGGRAVRTLALALAAVTGVLVAAPSSGAVSVSGDALYWFSSWAPQHRFVTVVASPTGPALRLISGTARRYAGRTLSWTCLGLDGVRRTGGTAEVRVGEPSLRAGRRVDYCHVGVSSQKLVGHGESEPILRVRIQNQTIALTPAGRAFVLRVRGTAALDRALFHARAGYDSATRSYPTAAQLVAKVQGTSVVALAAATDRPPVGVPGLWTDGAHRMRATYVMADGTVLYYERDAATRVTNTNAQEELDLLEDHEMWSPWYDFEGKFERSAIG